MCDDGKALIDHFEVAAYPTVVANMDANSLTTATSAELLLAKLDAAASAKKPCAVEGRLQDDGTLTVSVTAQEAAGYSLSIALLEDGIVAAQTGASESYVHDNVFRLRDEGVSRGRVRQPRRHRQRRVGERSELIIDKRLDVSAAQLDDQLDSQEEDHENGDPR